MALESIAAAPATLNFPWAKPPEIGTVLEVAPGLLWLRFPLPFRLNHVNLYLLADDGGWAVVDTGFGNTASRDLWLKLLEGPLAGAKLTRLIVTHFHPDHAGLAGWLVERFGLPLYMPRNEYLYSLALQHAPGDHGVEASKAFFLRHGLAADATAELLTKGQDYLRCTTGVPPHYHRLEHGQTFRVGARDFQVLTGGGHSMEQAMLYCAEQKLFLAADQVIAQISPNISVNAIEPEADSLGAYINSLRFLTETLPADVLVLAGHGLPFYGLHLRAAALIEHHAGRCALIRTACQGIEKSTADLIPVVFQQALDPHQTGFAFAEVLAHVNYMLGLGELRAVEAADGSVRYVSK